MSTPTPVKIAAAQIYERLRFEVLTLDAIEAALADTYALWEYQGMFCPDVAAHREHVLDLLVELADPDKCDFDHHGGCQAHGYLSLLPGETCPQARLKQLILARGGAA